ncbi:MAG: hypothetical protein ACRDO8_06180, partial [Nocardioidaceae bacterium]
VDLIAELSASGKTIVHATHDLGLALDLADRCLVFGEDHRLLASGAAADVHGDRALLERANLVSPKRAAQPSP